MGAVTTEQRSGVRVITVDDGKANALSIDLIAEIDAAVSEAEADDATTAAVLVGREGRFSAGFDLSVMADGDRSKVTTMVADGGALVRHLYGASIPVVAACTGHAIAAGALVLLGCDVRIGPDAPIKVGLNEVAIGMVLPDWALTIARTRLSKRHVEQCVVNAQLLDGAAAADAGFFDRAVAPEAVVDEAIAVAESFAALDPAAYAGTISAFRGDVLATMDAQIAADRSRG